MADNSARIAEIRSILRNGVKATSTDGTTVQYDLDSLRRELRQLSANDDTEQGRRPVASSIKLGGF